jgi:hypothetical protein
MSAKALFQKNVIHVEIQQQQVFVRVGAVIHRKMDGKCDGCCL